MSNTFNKMSIDDINVNGKKVLVRLDLNVPIVDGKITDDTRIVASLPTIKKLVNDGGKIILCSHLGKPEKRLSLAPVAKRLSELLGYEVEFVASDKVVDDKVKEKVNMLENSQVILLENTRFREEETKNGEVLSMEFASLCDVYVDDAFGTAHRAHSSNVGVTKFVDTCVCGYLMIKEINNLCNVVENPKHPFVAILGGAKISDKLKVIDKLLDKCDKLIIGGGMSYTFLKAKGFNIGKSIYDDSMVTYCKDMLDKAKKLKKEIILPIDSVCCKEMPDPITNSNIETKTFSVEDMDDSYMGLDIGEKTIELFLSNLNDAKTVIWNGPLGLFENEKFVTGTYCIAKKLATMEDANTIIGGGDSVSACNLFKLSDKMTHVSTGGGVTLEFLKGEELPGVECISDKV